MCPLHVSCYIHTLEGIAMTLLDWKFQEWVLGEKTVVQNEKLESGYCASAAFLA